MDLSDFYFLDDEGRRGALNVSVDDNVSKAELLSISRGEKKIIEPISFYHNIGGKPRDLISCSYAGSYLLIERFFELLEKESFTGWGSYPVKITGKKKEAVEGYRGLSIHGKCGKPDYLRREKIETIDKEGKLFGGKMFYVWKGFYFDLDSWDGSDFFHPEGNLHIIVTKRVKDCIEKAKFTGIVFEQITEYETDFNYNADGEIIYGGIVM